VKVVELFEDANTQATDCVWKFLRHVPSELSGVFIQAYRYLTLTYLIGHHRTISGLV